MFSEVRQAILPIALRNLKRREDLERAGLLIESLAKHWRDSKPFELLIVAPAVDVGDAAQRAAAFPRIEVSVKAESDFFRRFSPFYSLTSWYRQQLVKLEVPAMLGFGGFLTLDSDVCCVGDFDSRTFVHERPRVVALGTQAPSRLVAAGRRPRGRALRSRRPTVSP